MRTVGHRKQPDITFAASAARLAEGARFNDGLGGLPTGCRGFIRKGLYRFKSHADANRHDRDCLAEGMAAIALERALEALRARRPDAIPRPMPSPHADGSPRGAGGTGGIQPACRRSRRSRRNSALPPPPITAARCR